MFPGVNLFADHGMRPFLRDNLSWCIQMPMPLLLILDPGSLLPLSLKIVRNDLAKPVELHKDTVGEFDIRGEVLFFSNMKGG